MNKALSFLVLLSFLCIHSYGMPEASAKNHSAIQNGSYVAVVEGYDWGAAVSKLILTTDAAISSVNKDDFTVQVERRTDCGEIAGASAMGARTIVHAYISDAQGNNIEEGNHITLVLAVAPNLPIGSPIAYFRGETCSGNVWVDYLVTVTNKTDGSVWNTETGRIMPLIDKFDLTGSFTYNDITLTYASFEPQTSQEKSPLIIWLHGGGEGGTDPSIPLIANRAANYASDDIQFYFDGAYVLAPQTPTRWMDAGNGQSTNGQVDDIYYPALLALIDEYVASNPGVDPDRIYVGGCSNGGYMSFKLIVEAPELFAAGYISALAYNGDALTDQQVENIKNVPIWFVHAADDGTTVPDRTVLPVYNKLKDAGAPVHLSFYDHVVDITGFFGGEGYHYAGHWSWIYSHANESKYDFDGTPVRVNGKPVTIMEWMSAQSK